jgi:hypothetical protein
MQYPTGDSRPEARSQCLQGAESSRSIRLLNQQRLRAGLLRSRHKPARGAVMGNYTKGLTERRHHTQLREGYCLICGTFGPLSWDHVPPQGSITITKIEQAHLTEVMGVNSDAVIGVKSSNGSKFRTICKHCNSSHLGANDQEVARVYKGISEKIKQYFLKANSPVNHVHLPFDGMKFCRAMVGHV